MMNIKYKDLKAQSNINLKGNGFKNGNP